MSTTFAGILALALFAVYLVTGFGIRTWLQLRATGDHGFRGISGRPGSPECLAGVLFVVALVAGVLGPVTALAGLAPAAVLTHPVMQIAAAAASVAGIVGTLATQSAMGTSWRIGVDHTETTRLVTDGPFRHVRNPIFTFMALTGLGLALLTPNVVALAGAGLLLVALQLQVRVVEEPYLRATHGAAYVEYVATVGRFLPGIGRSTRTRSPIQQ